MIDGIQALYRQIAESIEEAINEAWTQARMHAIFYPKSSIYEGEYTCNDGTLRDFETSLKGEQAIRDLRAICKSEGKRLWGQAEFSLTRDGKFNMRLGYDHLDANGNTQFDEKGELKRHEARLRRLGLK